MSSEMMVACPSCSQAVSKKYLRTYEGRHIRLVVCKKCFLQFTAEDIRDGKRKPKLPKQMLTGEQLPLPF